MSVIAEFRVWSPELAMSDSLSTVQNVKLDIVQEVGTDPDRPYILFWARGEDTNDFEQALHDDETVSDIELYSEFDGRALYQVRVGETVEVVSYPLWVELGAEQIEAQFHDGWWHIRMRLPEREGIGTIESWCEENDVDFELLRIYTHQGRSSLTPELTDEQRAVLRVALEKGYFEVPRDGNLKDIAEKLGISSQAASERLRRGHRRLVNQQL